MTIVGIGGVPASGKSHLLQSFMANVAQRTGRTFVPKQMGLAMYEQLGHIFVMGRYTGVHEFAGTDRLSMNCYRTVKMLWRTIKRDVPHAVVLFEGNRLFKSDMLTFAESLGVTTEWAVLDVSPETLEHRHRERKDNQSEQILRARATELSRLSAKHPNIALWPNETPENQAANLARLLQLSEVN